VKLFECFAEKGFHTSIVTTFNVDLNAYESIALARLRDAGCNNNIVIADGRMLGYALGPGETRPRHAGRRYSIVGVPANGVFHPKLILQLGKSSGRLLVASANMTAAGLAGNLEVVGEVRAEGDDFRALPLLRAALAYVANFVADAAMPRKQIEWAMRRTPWIHEQSDGTVIDLEETGRLGFLSSAGPVGIGEQFAELVGRRKVKRLVVVSPYWDPALDALRQLRDRLGTKNVALLLQPQNALFPVHALGKKESVRLHSVDEVEGTKASRFAHAKVFIVETSAVDCVLYGSANCTEAALGVGAAPGENAEACLYRELPAGDAVQVLGLERALSTELSIADIPKFESSEEIPLEDLERHLPGRFELSEQTLRWWPPKGANVAEATIVLTDSDGKPVAGALTRSGAGESPARYRFDGRDAPHFATVRWLDFESSPGVVIVEEAIRQAQRKSPSRSVDEALSQLDNMDVSEGLWLLDIVQKLAAAEREARTGEEQKPVRRRSQGEKTQKPAGRVLTYREFIEGRSAKTAEVGTPGSLLGASHQESVREFLNALIGKNKTLLKTTDETDEVPGLSMGDETASGEEALEEDERFNAQQQRTRTDVDCGKKELEERRKYQVMRDTRQSIVKAVRSRLKTFQQDAAERPLGVVDLLRLRVLLVVVLGAGSRKADPLPTDSDASGLQGILPISGGESWRHLVGTLLFDFFRHHRGDRKPLISKVVLDIDSDDGLPIDVLECWATCYWAICATRVATTDRDDSIAPLTGGKGIAEDLYRYTQLLPTELLGEAVRSIFEGMSTRYAERLGVSVTRLEEEHRSLIDTVIDKNPA
jgi:hypothetical protein